MDKKHEAQEKTQEYVAIIRVRLTRETVEAYGGNYQAIRERAERYINNPRYYPNYVTKEEGDGNNKTGGS